MYSYSYIALNLTNKKNNDYEKVFDFNDVFIVTYIHDFL